MAMAFSATITDHQLDAVAREAATLFLGGHANDATDAVVKAASALGPSVTDEHVRRTCEKTYREIFERMHKTASGDRNVVFDPPVAQIAAERLRAAKVASARSARAWAPVASSGGAEKAAAGAPVRFRPTNVFDEVTAKAASAPAESAAADLRFVVRDMRHTVRELEGQKEAASAAVQATLLDLIKEAKQCIADGTSADDVVLAGAQGVTDVRPDIPERYIEEAASLLVRGLVATSTPLGEKAASGAVRVNTAHPLVVRYEKLAAALFDRDVVSVGLDSVRPEFRRARDGLLALSPG